MRRTLLILCVASLAATSLAADANSDFKRFMRRMMPQMERAFNRKDVVYLDKISTSDFTDTAMGRTMSKAESLKEMKVAYAQAKSVRAKFKILAMSASGNSGVAMTSGHVVMITKPRGGKDKSHRMVMDVWEKQTWIRSGKTWKIQKNEQTKPTKSTVDGKPFDPSKMGG